LRISALTALSAIVLTTAMITGAAAAPANSSLCKVVCSSAPAPAQAKPQAKPKPVMARPAPVRRVARHRARHHVARNDYARRDYYSYREAEIVRDEWHGAWHPAPNDAMIPGPPPYGPTSYSQSGGTYAEGYAQNYAQGYERSGACDCGDGLQIDRTGWTGGVGYGAGDEGFVDGYGMMHFASGFQNGPPYNSYGQSFQFNPSRAGPFHPRVMGGFAPGGAHMGGGYGPRR
jgi:hypothetical protein